MDNLTDFDNTKDVSDAAIEWVLQETGSPAFSVESVRSDARLGRGYPADCARILAARLIERYCPELLIDPVDQLVREEMAKHSTNASADMWRRGLYKNSAEFAAAKRLYLMGIEKGRNG